MAELDACGAPCAGSQNPHGAVRAALCRYSRARAVLSDPQHRAVARLAAERSVVLLRNENQLLPLNAEALRSVAVIGPFADAARDSSGPWIFAQDDQETVTVLAGIKAALGDQVQVAYSPGVSVPARQFRSIFESPEHKQAPRIEVDDEAEIARAAEFGARRRGRDPGARRSADHDRRKRLALLARSARPSAAIAGCGARHRHADRGAADERAAARSQGRRAAGADDHLVSRHTGRHRDRQSVVWPCVAGRQAAVQLAAQYRPAAAAVCAAQVASAAQGRAALLERAELARCIRSALGSATAALRLTG
ncbi:MAG: glycoside hydrolase family 3 C-terminal domain-containing protein [Rhodopseudomonas palustris]|nr:glycoside hydrolase family 3 C-terminal domain-containing protein [Rhodopseudomonas palustris]